MSGALRRRALDPTAGHEVDAQRGASPRRFARYAAQTTNVEESRFSVAPYPRPETVSLPKPAGATRDEAVLWAEAETEVQKKLSTDEYIQHRISLTERKMGDRSIWDASLWDASFQIDLKKS
ncbi:hypothetical protein ABIA52_000080 [Paenarthrobacter histidinolovorans]|uniref:Uncharacterized protein n=1 Tax=Paenarthrobacter histidinolovorans TaxID=43664 RepID=A0ABW8N4D8_9MICC